jgi:hypothetical protein
LAEWEIIISNQHFLNYNKIDFLNLILLKIEVKIGFEHFVKFLSSLTPGVTTFLFGKRKQKKKIYSEDPR